MKFAISVAVFACLMRSASAQPTSTPRAEQLYFAGQAAYDKQNFDAAIDAWQRSYELSREPGLLFNLAQAHRLRSQKGDCATALATYKKFVELDPTSTQRETAEAFAIEMQRCVDASVAKQTNRSDAVDAHPGLTKRIVGIASAGTGVALLATGLYFGHRASSLGNEVTSACDMGCDWAVYGPKDAAGRSAETKQYIFDGLGVAAIATGGILYWLGTREQRNASSITITSRRDSAEITWSRSW